MHQSQAAGRGGDAPALDGHVESAAGRHHPHAQAGAITAVVDRRLLQHPPEIVGDRETVELTAGAVEPRQVRREPEHRSVAREQGFDESTLAELVGYRGGRGAEVVGQLTADGPDQRFRLVQALVPLAHRYAVDGDSAAHTELRRTHRRSRTSG